MNKIAKVKAPKGFRFFIVGKPGDENICVNLYKISDLNKKDKTFIGRINLEKNYGKSYSTHSSLIEAYRNKGLGTLMYARAVQFCLENGLKVRSSGGSSEMAQRVWRGKSIRKHFKIMTRRYKDSSGQYYPNYDTFYAYSK